ncbi:glycosyltransferase [Flavobacteriaceae bacterium S356]|uniref:Glycosyltransferase n=1 Tax=Asprobacillus argus TaxID=3076534 RepID=A0ABU3LBK4_9FLAO|nr:glycosyltransferase [Flavobacteriaceae bacterium S356]
MKKIIVAPLNWGLGHASRCVPIIRLLIKYKYSPVIATDGVALLFLKKEFPELETIQLPSYNIKYGKNLTKLLLFQTPKILKAITAERKVIEEYIQDHDDVIGVISDNRFGVRSDKVPSVYITHQVNVLSGMWTWLTSFVHQKIIRRFDECWIPDEELSLLSGKLSRSKRSLHQKYIGSLSRFSKENKKHLHDVVVVLSGLEPNRTQLEEKLHEALEEYKGKIVFIRGVLESEQKKDHKNNITIYNYVLSQELQEILNTAKVVVSRSGYSSIMDYAVTGKKAVLIPTKGQTEQEYLAKYLAQKGNIVSVSENMFCAKDIERAQDLSGLTVEDKILNKELLSLFKGK